MSRTEAIRRLSQRKIDDEYKAAGILVNLDGHVPLDEAAPCYKPAREVVQAVVDAGLARIEHELWPLSSLKGTDERPGKDRKRRLQRANKRKAQDARDGVDGDLDVEDVGTDEDDGTSSSHY